MSTNSRNGSKRPIFFISGRAPRTLFCVGLCNKRIGSRRNNLTGYFLRILAWDHEMLPFQWQPAVTITKPTSTSWLGIWPEVRQARHKDRFLFVSRETYQGCFLAALDRPFKPAAARHNHSTLRGTCGENSGRVSAFSTRAFDPRLAASPPARSAFCSPR